MKIYMDVCCLCRPFDDFATPDGKRIQQEAKAYGFLFLAARHWPFMELL
jgi:hypothetical protein